jgi:hypothetical protein
MGRKNKGTKKKSGKSGRAESKAKYMKKGLVGDQ